jgi:hypothetical protein
LGNLTQAFPTMSLPFGCQSSGKPLLSPWMMRPFDGSTAMMRWITVMPAPNSPFGTLYAMMSPFT